MNTSSGKLALKTIEVAYKYGITIYDAAYAALAIIRDATLYTADEEIVSKISKGNVKHLKEFRTSNGTRGGTFLKPLARQFCRLGCC